MTGRCTRWQRWLPGSGGGLKVLNWNLHSFQLLDIIQVLDSISWVRCASGNVLRVNGVDGGINFGNMCKTQHFQFHPDLGGAGIFLGCEYKTQHFQFYPNIHAKHFGGWKHISRMCKKTNIFTSILIFVPNIWGVEAYF